VLVLEDGQPLTLNPYGVPELYYAPVLERMDHIEVYKGSGAIMWGPHTIGGVVNYISREPPRKLSINAELRYGSYGYLLATAGVGNTHGPIGYRLDVTHRRLEGPRALDLSSTDVTARFRLRLGSANVLALKLTFYDEASRATYLGPTTPQFEADPLANFAIHDRFAIRRYAGLATLTSSLQRGVVLVTNLYAYATDRSWRRQDYDRDDRGVPYERIIPAVPGELPTNDRGSLYFRNTASHRNRRYEVAGVEPRLTWAWQKGRVDGELTAGVRLHHERAHDAVLRAGLPTTDSGTPIDEEVRRGIAFAAFVQHRFTLFDKLKITPGFRLETFWSDREIARARVLDEFGNWNGQVADVSVRGTSFSYGLIPGLGLSYAPHRAITLYAGVHRGYAPPRTRDAVTPSGLDLRLASENSWNYEAGLRGGLGRWLLLDVAGFFIDFQNQLVPPAEAGGAIVGDPSLFNTGAVNGFATHQAGLETSLQFDLATLLQVPGLATPLSATYTWVAIADIVGHNKPFDGFRFPYTPEHILFAQLRVQHRIGLEGQVSVSYVSSQVVDRDNTIIPTVDGLLGLIPGYALIDARVAYTYARWGLTAFVAGKNLADNRYISSRAPSGIQVGMPRQIFGGLSYAY